MSRRWILVAVLAVGLASGLWAGGKAEGGAAGKSVQLTQWVFPFATEQDDRTMFGAILTEFQKTYPNISVNLEFFPWDARRERMSTALAAGTAPDVVYLNDDMKPLFEGKILDLNKYLTKQDLADFKPAAIAASTYKGVLCYLPILINSVSLVFNMDVVQKAGITADWLNTKFLTWDDFLSYCAKVKATGAWPYTMGPADAGIIDELSNWMYQAGGDWYNADYTKSTTDTPQAIRMFKYVVSLWDNGYINPADKDKTGAEIEQGVFPAGGIGAVMVQNQNIPNAILKTNPNMHLVYAYPFKDKTVSSNGTIAGYGSFTTSKNPAEAVAWIKAITGAAGMTSIDKVVNFIPTRISLDATFKDMMKDPIFNRAVENTEWFVPTVPPSPVGPAALEEVKSGFQKMILHQASVEDAEAEMTARINKLLDDYYKKTK